MIYLRASNHILSILLLFCVLSMCQCTRQEGKTDKSTKLQQKSDIQDNAASSDTSATEKNGVPMQAKISLEDAVEVDITFELIDVWSAWAYPKAKYTKRFPRIKFSNEEEFFWFCFLTKEKIRDAIPRNLSRFAKIYGFSEYYDSLKALNLDVYQMQERKDEIANRLNAARLEYSKELNKYRNTILTINSDTIQASEDYYDFDNQTMSVRLKFAQRDEKIFKGFVEQGLKVRGRERSGRYNSSISFPLSTSEAKLFFGNYKGEIGKRYGKCSVQYWFKAKVYESPRLIDVLISEIDLVKVELTLLGSNNKVVLYEE